MNEETLSLRSDVVILSKERERFHLEREEFERQLSNFEALEQDFNQLSLEKSELIDETRRLSS